MRKNSNVIHMDHWPVHHWTGLEHALRAMRRHNKRRKRFNWGPEMMRGVRASWGRWLFWGQIQPWYDDTEAIENLVTPERVEAYVLYLTECGNAEATIRHRIMGLERMMAVLAPDAVRGWLTAIKSRFAKTGDRAKKRARIQFTDDLIRFASALANATEELAKLDPVKGALLFRVALQIMWSAYRTMRLKNFHQLRLGVEVKFAHGDWRLDIPASATKRGNAYDPVLPARLVRLLDVYRWRHLKVLGGKAETGPLWLSKGGQRQSARSINYHVCKKTEKHFGRSMRPHLFRDAAMTTVSIQMPENVRMGMHLLGNRNQDCMEEHYDQSQRVIAETRYNSALDDWEDAA